MAYTYDNLSKLIEQNNANSNIFGQGGTSDQGGGGQGAQGSQPVQKTSTGGSVGSAQGSAPSAPAATQAPQTPQNSSAKAIVDKAAKSNLDTSAYTKGVNQGISKAQEQLTSEANAYTANQQGKAKKALDAQTIERAQYAPGSTFNPDSGPDNTDYFGQVENLLRGDKTKADEFKFTGSTKFDDLDQMASQGGLQQVLQKKGAPTYNQGMAGLDAMLISKDKGYQDELSKARQARTKLREEQAKLEGGELRDKAQAAIDAQEASARQAALQQLSGLRGNIDASLARQAADYNKNLEDTRARQKQLASEQELAAIQEAKAAGINLPDIGNIGGWASPDLLDESKYFNVGSYATPQSFASTEDANRYNRILSLLGQGGQQLVAGSGANPTFTFDKDRYKQDLIEATRNAYSKPRDLSQMSGKKDKF